MGLRLLSWMIPHLAGTVSLAQFYLLAQVLKPIRLDFPPEALLGAARDPDRRTDLPTYPPFCPSICRPAAILAFLAAGLPVPQARRLSRILAAALEAWPGPITASGLSFRLGSPWPGEVLKVLWPLAHAGVLRQVRSQGRLYFYLQRPRMEAHHSEHSPGY
jgi:hypothetical protein